jgi:Leucine-rich repeat (LRR) protein
LLDPHAEDWANVTSLNASFQELGDAYQIGHARRVLEKLTACEKLSLANNELTELRGVRLPACRELDLSNNRFARFGDMPSCPVLESLCLTRNCIDDLNGLRRFPRLHSLVLHSNPVEFAKDYRVRCVFLCACV